MDDPYDGLLTAEWEQRHALEQQRARAKVSLAARAFRAGGISFAIASLLALAAYALSR